MCASTKIMRKHLPTTPSCLTTFSGICCQFVMNHLCTNLKFALIPIQIQPQMFLTKFSKWRQSTAAQMLKFAFVIDIFPVSSSQCNCPSSRFQNGSIKHTRETIKSRMSDFFKFIQPMFWIFEKFMGIWKRFFNEIICWLSLWILKGLVNYSQI